MQGMEIGQALELTLLFFFGAADQIQLVIDWVAVRIAKGVDADDGSSPVCLSIS